MASNEFAKLLEIQDNNSPSVITLAPDDKPYFIDLNTRKIEKIDRIVVETDHRAETVYFKTHRYFDNMDLTNTVCIIQYENAQKEQRAYVVPFYDVDTYSNGDKEKQIEDPMILFPWVISEDVTPKDGIVDFSIRFYRVDTSGSYFTYSLSTLPSQLEIEGDIGFKLAQIQTDDERASIEENYSTYFQIAADAAREGSLTWIVLN